MMPDLSGAVAKLHLPHILGLDARPDNPYIFGQL